MRNASMKVLKGLLRRIHLPDVCSGNARTRSFQGR